MSDKPESAAGVSSPRPACSPIAEWERFANDCDKAAGESERMASVADNDIERTRWRSHADNFASAARRTREILANAGAVPRRGSDVGTSPLLAVSESGDK
jgi:hypothetical protein